MPGLDLVAAAQRRCLNAGDLALRDQKFVQAGLEPHFDAALEDAFVDCPISAAPEVNRRSRRAMRRVPKSDQ